MILPGDRHIHLSTAGVSSRSHESNSRPTSSSPPNSPEKPEPTETSSPLRPLRYVGEDEADPGHGLITWVSPAAERLIGCIVGDEIAVAGRRFAIVQLSAARAS